MSWTRETWAQHKLDEACARIAGASEGNRHDAIVSAAGMVADYVADGAIPEGVVRAALTDEAMKRGKKESEIRRAIDHSLEKGTARGVFYPESRRRDYATWGDGQRYALNTRDTPRNATTAPAAHVDEKVVVRFTGYERRNKRGGYPSTWTWGELAKEVENANGITALGKNALELWAGHELQGDDNHKGRIALAMHAVFLDYDDEPGFTPDAVRNWWRGYRLIAHTSASHNVSKGGKTLPRGRVIVALSRPVSPEEWPTIVAWFMDGTRGAIGKECREFCRMYFMAAKTDGYWSLSQEGGAIDVDAILEADTPRSEASHVSQWGGDAWKRILNRSEGLEPLVPLPWPRMNADMDGGLRPGLFVLVGPTGTGKTQWALQCGLHAARNNVPVMCVSLELDPPGMKSRMVSLLAGGRTHWSDVNNGSRVAVREIMDSGAIEELDQLPIHTEFGEANKWHADDLKHLAERMRSWYPNKTDRHGDEIRGSRPIMFIVDYLQIMGPVNPGDTRQRVSEASTAAREIARTYDAIVLMVSSTARGQYSTLGGSASNSTKYDPRRWRPFDGDPRDYIGTGKESGEIEFSCDALFVLVRPEQDDTASPWVWVAIPKLRTGSPFWSAKIFENGGRYTEPNADRQVEWTYALDKRLEHRKNASERTRKEQTESEWESKERKRLKRKYRSKELEVEVKRAEGIGDICGE